MKSQVNVVPEEVPAFKPVAIEITFESEEEIGAFFAIMNHGTITGAVSPEINCWEINKTVKAALDGRTPKYEAFHSRIHQRIIEKKR